MYWINGEMDGNQRTGFLFYVIFIVLGVSRLTNLENPRREVEKWRSLNQKFLILISVDDQQAISIR